jgi:shikimate kinase
MQTRSILLIGPRGSGKSTVGKLLAKSIALPFFDADVELETRNRRTIQQIFAQSGEATFRDMEAEVLRELLAKSPIVLATGGGAVLRDENRRLIKNAGFVVWLTGTVDTLWQRIGSDPVTALRRPNLGVGGPTEIAMLLQQRESLYRECANLTLATDGREPAEITSEILQACHHS